MAAGTIAAGGARGAAIRLIGANFAAESASMAAGASLAWAGARPRGPVAPRDPAVTKVPGETGTEFAAATRRARKRSPTVPAEMISPPRAGFEDAIAARIRRPAPRDFAATIANLLFMIRLVIHDEFPTREPSSFARRKDA